MTLRAATAMSTSWNSSPSMMQVPSGLACCTWMIAVSNLGTGTATTFWPAEEYHQDYYDRKGAQPYCHAYTKRF